MGSHVFRPLYAIAALVTIILAARAFIVPPDFAIGARGYMYGWHRTGNEAEWKSRHPKYQEGNSCRDCHSANVDSLKTSAHAALNCQNCHGPAGNHPADPSRLPVDTRRERCLRCHASLGYANSARAAIKSIDPAKHNPGTPCATCHNPHKPDLEGLK